MNIISLISLYNWQSLWHIIAVNIITELHLVRGQGHVTRHTFIIVSKLFGGSGFICSADYWNSLEWSFSEIIRWQILTFLGSLLLAVTHYHPPNQTDTTTRQTIDLFITIGIKSSSLRILNKESMIIKLIKLIFKYRIH